MSVQHVEMLTVGDAGYHDLPALAVRQDGRICLSWKKYLRGREYLLFASDEDWTRSEVLAEAEGILHPGLAVDKRDDPWMYWVEKNAQSWRLKVMRVADRRPVSLSPEAHRPFHPHVVFDGRDERWAVWTAFDGKRYQIFGKRGDEAPAILSTNQTEANRPFLLAGRTDVFVGWDSARRGRYGLAVRSLLHPEDGTLKVGGVNRQDCSLRLATAGDNCIWMVWSSSNINDRAYGYCSWGSPEITALERQGPYRGGYGYREDRKVGVALLEVGPGGRLKVKRKGFLQCTQEALKPNILALPDGGACLAYYQPHGDHFSVHVRILQMDAVSEPVTIGEDKGAYTYPCALAAVGGRIIAAFQSDARSWRSRDGDDDAAASWISICTMAPPEAVKPLRLSGGLKLRGFEPTLFHDAVKRRKRGIIKIHGRRHRLFWGDTHMHSECSFCSRRWDGTVHEKFEYAKQLRGLDFAVLTDHAKHMTDYDWHYHQMTSSLYEQPGYFLTFPGYEWGETHHRCLMFLEEGHAIWRQRAETGTDTLPGLWEKLPAGKAITLPHHPAEKTFREKRRPFWEFSHPGFEPAVEIYQVRGSYEAWNCPENPWEHRWRYMVDAPGKGAMMKNFCKAEDWLDAHAMVVDGLLKGFRLGILASGEHEGVGVCGVWARAHTREAIFDAFLQRRLFGTTNAMIRMAFWCGDAFMGDEVQAAQWDGVVKADITGTAPVRRLEILRNGEVVHCHEPSLPDVRLLHAWRDTAPFEAASFRSSVTGKPESFYYLRVTQQDGEMAWSSPIWIV